MFLKTRFNLRAALRYVLALRISNTSVAAAWRRGRVLAVALAAALVFGDALAVEPFGLVRFGMTKKEVLGIVSPLGTVSGDISGLGFIAVDASDRAGHTYVFNFCNGKLMDAIELRPFEMEGLVKVVDEAIRLYGQPYLVSAERLPAPNNKLIGVAWNWKVDDVTMMMVDEIEGYFRQTYRISSECWPVHFDK
jgi:hypothetical protein